MTMHQHDTASQTALGIQMKQTAINALIAAGLMLFFGYNSWSGGLSAVEGAPRLYALSVTAFVWTLLIGGAAMLASAGLLFSGWRPALAFDAVLTAIVGALLLAIGATQLAYVQNFQGVLLLIFGLIFLRSAHVSWSLYRSAAGIAASPLAPGEPAAPVVEYHSDIETSARPEVPPENEPSAPPPSEAEPPEGPDGFLADLGRDENERN